MRCNFVDLYYALYGSKTPNFLSKTDTTKPVTTMGLPRIPKLSEAKPRAISPIEINDEPVIEERRNSIEMIENIKRETEAINDHVDDKDESINNVKVSFSKNFTFYVIPIAFNL